MTKASFQTLPTPSFNDIKGTSLSAAVLMIIALSFIGVWANLLGYSPPFLESTLSTDSIDLSLGAFLIGRVFIAAMIIIFYRFLEKNMVAICVAISIMFCVVTCLYGLNAYQTLLSPLSVGLVCQFLIGLGYPVIVCIIYTTMAQKMSIELAVIMIVVSQITEQIFSNGLNALLPAGTEVVLCIVLPLISCVAFLRFNKQEKTLKFKKIGGFEAHYSITLAMSSFIALFMVSALSIVGFWGNERVDYFTDDKGLAFIQTIIACVLVILLSYFTLYRRSRYPLSMRYQLPFLVVIAAFFCAQILPSLGMESFVLDTLLLSVEFFSHILAWTIIVSTIQKMEVSPARLISSAFLLHSVVWFTWDRLASISVVYSNILLGVICFLLIVVTSLSAQMINRDYIQKDTLSLEALNLLLLEKRPLHSEDVSSITHVDTLENRCRALGMYYGLTSREIDVVILIAQGRSQHRIQDELMLSASTVKTHTNNIFIKMNVHSRQEIIDMGLKEMD